MSKFRLPSGGLTPNRKIVKVGQQFSPSNLNIADQQPTTRNVFDYIKLTPSANPQTLQYFRNVNTKQFPFTNITENKFNSGESLSVLRMYLAVMLVTTATGEISGLVDLDYASQLEKFYASQLNVFIDNNRVVKDLAVTSFKGQFNPTAKFGAQAAVQPTAGAVIYLATSQCVFELDDVMVIPENITYRAELQIPAFAAAPFASTDTYLGLFFEGLGALVSPKNNF